MTAKSKRPTGPAPSEADLSDIRRLFNKAGGEANFRRWKNTALGRREAGRPKGTSPHDDFDHAILKVAQILRIASNGRLTLHAALQGLARRHWTPERGLRRQSMVKRLMNKANKTWPSLKYLPKWRHLDLTNFPALGGRKLYRVAGYLAFRPNLSE
jgi:hypothetical protein